jgi:hypothetical protein
LPDRFSLRNPAVGTDCGRKATLPLAISHLILLLSQSFGPSNLVNQALRNSLTVSKIIDKLSLSVQWGIENWFVLPLSFMRETGEAHGRVLE